MTISRKEPVSFRRWEADSFDQKKPEPPPAAPPRPEEPPPAAVPTTKPEPEPALRLPTAEDIERLREEARAAGYAAGLAEGRTTAAEENRLIAVETARQFGELTDNLKHSLEQLDQTVAEQLLALAVEIAAQVTRGQIAVREDALLPVVREAITALPLSHGEMTLRLNPADAANLHRLLGDELSQDGMQIVEDDSISIGGCLLQAGTSEIDARIETRWKRVLETIGAAPRAWQNP
ncbi:flagellar assembly protein FliH [Azonexus sp.]|jgi:flagellar assembly protein FliH|uniref:flagellar assembly protein FliH n=1 Tax=Azonexus sp. TaxID=1872668 RepID=UPI00282562EF|nr:flagellar assembly protein FliH [Azonexus sp.]MDR1995076.1 flagellar assembly protein FliH [Azonexus sp.]